MTVGTGRSTGSPTASGTASRELVARLKQYRRIATRYDKRPRHYLVWLTLAAILLWL